MLLWQLVARFPSGMMTIGLLTWAERRFESYAHGGLLVAAFTLGFAAGSSLSTRLVRRIGSAAVLRADAAICACAMLFLVARPWDFAASLGLTAVAGLCFPPVTPLARSLYPRLSAGPRLLRVYSLDAIAQEGIWVLAPLCAVGIAGSLGPAAVIAGSAIVVVVGTLGFSWLGELRRHEPRRPASGAPPSGRVPRVAVGFFLIGFFLVASGACAEVFVVERYGYESLTSGLLLALMAAGSIAGGLLFARRPVTRFSLACRMLLVVAGLALAAFAPRTGVLAGGFFLSGAGIAPSFTAMHARIAVVTPASRTAEVYAFANTTQLVGMSAGSAVAGVLVSAAPAGLTLLVAAGSVALAVLVALVLGARDRG